MDTYNAVYDFYLLRSTFCDALRQTTSLQGLSLRTLINPSDARTVSIIQMDVEPHCVKNAEHKHHCKSEYPGEIPHFYISLVMTLVV